MSSAHLAGINGKTRLMGVIGQGIAYTRSPAMHNHAALLLGVDIAYLPIDLLADQVAPFLRLAWEMQAVGFNVTTPHKALVASLLPDCPLTSVNTIYRGKEGWEAASTDGGGFAAGLARMGHQLANFSKVVILGDGGVVTAILGYMVGTLTSLPRLTILRRSGRQDQALAALWRGSHPVVFGEFSEVGLRAALDLADSQTLLIQATNAPHHGDDLQALCPALEGYTGAVCDLVYGKPSRLYAAAVAKGLRAQDGEAMLVEQARLAQRLWWGKAASYEDLASMLR